MPTIDEVYISQLEDGHTGWVYVVGNETGEFVKIGWTKQVRQRLAALQTYIPTPLRVYALIAGARALEGGLHDAFAAQRTMGEWFRLEGQLLAWLERKRPLRRMEPALAAEIRQRMAAVAAMKATGA